jgi:hypothetical protein
MRSGLLILGVAIGITTILMIVTVLSGLSRKIYHDLASANRPYIYMTKYDLIVSGDEADEQSKRKNFTRQQADEMASLCPDLDVVEYMVESDAEFTVRYGAEKTPPIGIEGCGPGFIELFSMHVDRGRFISDEDVAHRERVVVLAAVAAVLLVTLVAATGSYKLAVDFHAGYLDAAQAVRSGGSPYSGADELPYVYPPVLAELLVPFTFLPEDVASFLAFVGSFAAVMGALALVGVRDVRCYAAVVIWAPGWNALEMANVTAVLTLLAALVWRYRDETWPSAGALGAALSVKLFFWPLLMWAAATRRVHTALLAVVIAVVAALASWAVIGFAGFTSFPDQLREVEFEDSYSLVGMAAALGFDPTVGRVAMVIAGGALLVVVGILSRRGDDARAFTCAIGATLVLTPVVWLHYLVLLAVPLGIARPRFAPIWLLPIVLWVCPRDGNGDGLQPFLPLLVVLVLMLALLGRPALRVTRAVGHP